MTVLRHLRNLLDVRASEVAHAAGISTRQLHRLERGLSKPTPDTLTRLDDAFEAVIAKRLRAATTERRGD